MSSFRYRVLVEDTQGGQREVRFDRLEAPRLDPLYGSKDDLSDFENGAEVSIDPDEHAKTIASLRAKQEAEQAARQAESLTGLGKSPDKSDGVAAKGTESRQARPAQNTPSSVEPKNVPQT